MTDASGSHAAPTVALRGGTVVVNLDPPEVLTSDVVLAGDRVVSLGNAPNGVPRRDCTGTLVMPGNVCAHHHLYSALARGMPYGLAPPLDFTEILQRVWWRLDRALDEDSVRASAIRGGLDALLSGTTTVVDHHASPNSIDGSLDVIADALEELGFRSVLCYEVTDRDGAGRASAGVAENRRFLANERALARGMMGAHASFTLSDETLAVCVETARGAGAGVHIHVAEDAPTSATRSSVAACAMERLQSAGVVTEQALLAHCVHVDATEIEIVSSSGATVVCNPRSNMNNAVGQSPFNLTHAGQGGPRHRRHRRGHGDRVPGGVLQGQGGRGARGALVAARAPGRGWPPRGAHLRRAVARHASPGCTRGHHRLRLPVPDTAQRRQPRRTLGVRDLAGPGSRRLRRR